MIVIPILTAVTEVSVIARAVTMYETMAAKAGAEMTIVNVIQAIVDIVMSMKMRNVGEPIRRYPLETVRIEKIINAKSDRFVN